MPDETRRQIRGITALILIGPFGSRTGAPVYTRAATPNREAANRPGPPDLQRTGWVSRAEGQRHGNFRRVPMRGLDSTHKKHWLLQSHVFILRSNCTQNLCTTAPPSPHNTIYQRRPPSSVTSHAARYARPPRAVHCM